MNRLRALCVAAWVCLGITGQAVGTVNLLERYPTMLTSGDASPETARAWEFGESDIFHISRFEIHAGDKLRIDCGEADLGIGHSKDGAVWAVVLPRTKAELKSAQSDTPEPLAQVWLRFHPREIAALF